MSILIKGAQILDGNGNSPFKADILVLKDKISAIGDFRGHRPAETVIDGFGCYAAPGFIDVDTDSDHYLTLFTNPGQEDFLKQGVTTIFGGMCGYSLAPLVYGSMESVREWSESERLNVDWRTTKEFLSSLRRMTLGVNFGTLSGHLSMRQNIVRKSRALSGQEMKILSALLDKSLRDGSFGMSSSLGYAAGEDIENEEIVELLKTVKDRNGIYSTHLRDYGDGLIESVKDSVGAAVRSGISTIISHFEPYSVSAKKYEQALGIIGENTAAADIHFDIFPYDTSVVVLSDLLPKRILSESVAETLARLGKPGYIKQIQSFWSKNKIDPETMVIAGAPKNDYVVGKSIREFSQNRGLEPAEGVFELMRLTRMRGTMAVKNIDEKLIEKGLLHSQSLIASNSTSFDPSEKFVHERSKNTFTKYLEIATKSLSIEIAVKKITSVPARIFNLKNRGLLKEGNLADLVLIRDNRIKDVIVSGKIAVRNGEIENSAAGQVLKHDVKKKR
ncbi:MAG: amidohydrolase family protein [Patescibacteria group bacterium]|nr:amidohydrolase family protein [Patescibacteria group bacterium]MCL5261773.1 amidohydrolase family protein [Patescibacteria group bacterium]